MSPLLPKTLAGRTLSIVVAGLVMSHIASVLVFSDHRADVLVRADEQHVARHVAAIADIVRNVPTDWRDRIVRSSDGHAFKVYVSAEAGGSGYRTADGRLAGLSDFITREMRTTPDRPISAEVQDLADTTSGATLEAPTRWLQQQLQLAHGHERGLPLLVSIPLPGGQFLNFSAALPLTQAPGWTSELLVIGSFAAAALLLSAWAVRRLSAPLRSLAGAAASFGRDLQAPPLAETGPSEVRQAAHAFNEMHGRLRRLVENRTRMLAAISHDLRTPLTLLRLRAETIEDVELRSKMLATLAEMDSMVSSTLAFAREETAQEERRTTDVTSLVESVCDDLADAGQPVTCRTSGPMLCECRPVALKRALTNLIGNAVKYGTRARLRTVARKDLVEITIEDDGPGIPQEEWEQVFLPFYRVETSRSRETGGLGLGMSVAQSVIDAHGGSISLSNRAEGGLRVQVCLPN